MIPPSIQQLLKKRLGPEISHDILKLSAELRGLQPNLFMDKGYEQLATGVARHNGRIFEGLFLAVLGREGIRHLILDAEYEYLPYSSIDVAIYSSTGGPFLISLKSSLRERWKQSDLEFSRIKSINKDAVCAIATLEDAGMPLRLQESDRLLGCDHVIDCRVPSLWDKFLKDLHRRKNVECMKDNVLGLRNFALSS